MGVQRESHRGRVETSFGGHIHLREKNLGVDHGARRDHRDAAWIEDARGDQRESEFLIAYDDGVSGVVATLEPNHVVGVLGEEVNDTAFAFVTPLGAENDGG